MDNLTPAAPVAESMSVSSEAPNTNINTTEVNTNGGETANPAMPQVSPKAQIPEAQVEAWNKFMEANGGFEKAFQKVKDTIAKPQPQAPQSTQPMVAEAPTTPQGQVAPNPEFKMAEGYLSPKDIAMLQYNKMLSDAYPELDTEGWVTKGDFVKEMTSLGIPVVDAQGNMNNASIRKFFDLKKQTLPPTQVETPVTTIPLANYIEADGAIDTREKAIQVMGQGSGHPQYEAAVRFMRESMVSKKNIPTQQTSAKQ